MSQVQFSTYPDFGEKLLETARYSQAARIPAGETVTISGQGGWDRTTGKISADRGEEINQAFDNVHHALLAAGAPGISSVYKLVVYYCPMDADARKYTAEARSKFMPDQRPLLTAIGVASLALEGMHIEIEAWAMA